jgi:ankyrin repeat protein
MLDYFGMSKAKIQKSVCHLDLDSTQALLQRTPSLITVEDRGGRNLLHLACSASCKELGVPESVSARVVKFLLDNGLDVESTLVTDEYPCNSVWFAVARGRNATLVRLLVGRGATPRGLFAAGWNEDVKLLALLITLGAPVDERAEDETPFLHCWNNGRFGAARFLVRKGADVNFQDSAGRTALHYGVRKEFEPKVLRALVRMGASADVEDRDGISPRRLASRKRDKRFLEAIT